jgi:protein-disulfide isomerase
MTNIFINFIKRFSKFLLVLFLIFVAFVVFIMFSMFSEVEKRLSKPEVDYSNLLNPNYNLPLAEADAPGQSQSSLIEGDGSNFYLGTQSPKITIVEFADFACPYCKRSFSKIREISINYKNDIKYIFRDLPIITDYSASLALAARCAGEQGLFWTMHDRLFLSQGVNDEAGVFELAKKSGADLARFENCFKTEKYLPNIKKDYQDAQTLGIERLGTPVWFINGQRIAGDIPEEIFNQILESYSLKTAD